MTYTKKQFAKELRDQLRYGYDVKRISRRAYKIYMEYCDKFEPGLRDVVMEIVAMEEGYEFEMSEDEILELVKELEKSQ